MPSPAEPGSPAPAPAPVPATLPFAEAPYDRQAHLRADPDWWDRLQRDTRTRVLLVGDDAVATADGQPRELSHHAASELLATMPADERLAVQPMLLGADAGGPVAALSVPSVPPRLAPQPARTVTMGSGARLGSLLVHALGLANWHRTHQFCARCGQRSVAEEAGHRRRCPHCGAQHFPRTDPAVIMLVTDDSDRALLGHSPQWLAGRFSTLAGFVEPGESLEDAVRREVVEETGIVTGEVTYAASQPWPFPSSLMLGFTAHAETTHITVDGDEITEARWFTRAALGAASAAGHVGLPPRFSISRWLVDRWHGGSLSGEW